MACLNSWSICCQYLPSSLPDQRHHASECAAAVGQRQRAQRAVVGLLRVVQQQHTAATWQVAHASPRERFEDGGGIPFSVRQDASQAAFDGICLGTRRHPPQLRGHAW